MTRLTKLVLLPFAAATLVPAIAAAEVSQPQEIIHRPLTAPEGQAEARGTLSFGITPDATATFLDITGGYGITNQFEIRAGYGLTLDPFEAKGALGAALGVSLTDTGNFAIAGRAGLAYDLASEALAPFEAGLDIRFKLNEQVAIYSLAPHLSIALEETGDARPISAFIPVSLGFQATPQIFAGVSTSIATLNISDSATSFIFADRTPLGVSLFFSPSNTIDLGASVGWADIVDSADVLSIALSAALYL